MRKIIITLAGISLAATALAQSGPKMGKNGGVGSSSSTFSAGEPTGGTYAINGTTGSAVFTSVSSTNPIGLESGGTGGNTAATARTSLGLGSSAVANVGTSGANIPLLNGLNAWSGQQTFGTTAGDQSLFQTTGHLGMGGKTNAANGYVYVGNGAGSLTDNGIMGLKVKLDGRRDGIQSNINVNSGSASGSVRSILGRLDIDDATSTGDAVALWGDTWVRSSSARNSWGANIYTEIGDATNPGVFAYAGTGIGAEIGLNNYSSTAVNPGGILNLVSHGTNKIKFALKLGSGGNPDPFGNNPPGMNASINVENFILAGDDTSVSGGPVGRGPANNFIWYGPLAPNNVPTGTPKFQVDKSGAVLASSFKPVSPECANIVHYGADRTGSAVSDGAWDSAIAATQAGRQCVYLPSGEYKFSTAKSLSISATHAQGSLTIKGDGSELTRLNFASNTSGISITLNTAYQSFHVQDLAILAGGWSTSTSGLSVTQAATVSNPAYSAPSDITRIVVRGNDGYAQANGFKNAIKLDKVSNVNVIGGAAYGAGDIASKASVCLSLSGSASTNAVVFNIIGATFNSCDTGLLYGSSVEGVSVNQTNMVGNNIGIFVPSGSTDAAQLSVTGSHFNNYATNIDLEVDPGGVTIANNFFIVNTQLTSANGIVIQATQDYSIANNVFVKQGSGSASGILIGQYGTHSGIISGNTFDSMQTAISLLSGSQRSTVGINSFSTTVIAKVSNSGTNNIVAANCSGSPTSGFSVTNGVITAC